MIKLLIFAAVILLSGCDYQVHSYEIEGYTENCKDKRGIRFISNLSTRAQCNNGSFVGSSLKKEK